MSEAIKPMTQGAATTTQRAQARHRQVCSGVAVPFGLAPRLIVVSTTLRTRLDHAFHRTEPTSPGLRAGDGHLLRSARSGRTPRREYDECPAWFPWFAERERATVSSPRR